MKPRVPGYWLCVKLAHIAAILLPALLISSCAPEDAVPTAREAESPARIAPPSPASTEVDPRSAQTAADSAKTASPVEITPGFETAAGVSSDPSLSTEAPSGKTSAHWAGSGRDVDSKSPWRSIAYDGIHDRESDAVGLLQEPRSAFLGLPRSISGDYVDWVAALRSGAITPRAHVRGQGAMDVRDDKIVMTDTKTMPHVTFPHRAHSEWLACGNCHDWLFKAQAGANEISMSQIARGRACGLCHGKVAFPPTECFRCHSGPRPKG